MKQRCLQQDEKRDKILFLAEEEEEEDGRLD